jgi:hypothetical protein
MIKDIPKRLSLIKFNCLLLPDMAEMPSDKHCKDSLISAMFTVAY